MDAIRRRTSNRVVGIFLLIILAILAGPNVLPRLVSNVLPFVDEGAPCSRLRVAEDRDRHQSWIGRLATEGEDPITVEISPGLLPTTATGTLDIKIIVTNNTVGTIPLVFPGDILVNNPSVNGLGVVFGNSAIQQALPEAGLIPDSNIRLLTPQQRCVERVSILGSQLGTFGIGPGTPVRAYYRNTAQGVVNTSESSIFNDQGLWVGVAASDPIALEQEVFQATGQ